MPDERSSQHQPTHDPEPMESLYPFLYAGHADLDGVLAEVRSSTAAKALEIVELREECLRLHHDRLIECATAMAERAAAGGRLFAFGNGGSSTDAQDMASLFMHPPGGNRPLPAFCLTGDVAVVTALSNDIGFEVVFARQLAAFASPGDFAVGLSTSGNSDNLVRGFAEASRRGLLTIGLAGYDGGRMAELDTIDHLFVVPSSSVHRIQEAQTTLYHVLWELMQAVLSDDVPSSHATS
jgi:D-sedoheptulose 7-phosphate isomerase